MRRNPFYNKKGRWFHTLDRRVRGRLLGIKENEKSVKDEKIDEETAINAAANLMSECIIFLIAGFGVTAEVYRNAKNSAAKEAVKIEQMKNLIYKKEEISSAVEKQAAVINKLGKLVDECISHEPTATTPENNS